MTTSPESWWGSVTRDELDCLTEQQRDSAVMAMSGIGQRPAAAHMCISRSTYRDHLDAAAERIIAYRLEQAA